jgi:hypothetical protein
LSGLLVALAAALVLVRKGGHGWSSFELMLVAGVPCVALLTLALAGASDDERDPAEPWRALLLVAAIVLAPVALLLALHWLGASTRHRLYDAGVLCASALIALGGARRTRAPYAVLLAGIALLGAWMLVWSKLLGGHTSVSTLRWLALSGGVVLVLAGIALSWDERHGARELVTAGGIGAVGAALSGVIVGAFAVLFSAVGQVFNSSGGSGEDGAALKLPGLLDGGSLGHHLHISGGQTFGWNLGLLAISLALLLAAGTTRNRGAGYVGAFGALGFIGSVGAELTRLESGRSSTHSILVWPVALLVLGLAGLLLSSLRTSGLRR